MKVLSDPCRPRVHGFRPRCPDRRRSCNRRRVRARLRPTCFPVRCRVNYRCRVNARPGCRRSVRSSAGSARSRGCSGPSCSRRTSTRAHSQNRAGRRDVGVHAPARHRTCRRTTAMRAHGPTCRACRCPDRSHCQGGQPVIVQPPTYSHDLAHLPCRGDHERCPERARQCRACPHRLDGRSVIRLLGRVTTRTRTSQLEHRLRVVRREQFRAAIRSIFRFLLVGLSGCLAAGLGVGLALWLTR
jgi:hypothetical protein